MRLPLALTLCAMLGLSACGGLGAVRDSRLNPMNWFGASQPEAPSLGPTSDVIDNRPLVPQVSSLSIERTSSGAIVRAEAVMPSAGWWDAELVADNQGRAADGVLTLRFVAAAPRAPVTGTNELARTITAVYTLRQAQLDTVAEVVVTGETNSRRARR